MADDSRLRQGQPLLKKRAKRGAESFWINYRISKWILVRSLWLTWHVQHRETTRARDAGKWWLDGNLTVLVHLFPFFSQATTTTTGLPFSNHITLSIRLVMIFNIETGVVWSVCRSVCSLTNPPIGRVFKSRFCCCYTWLIIYISTEGEFAPAVDETVFGFGKILICKNKHKLFAWLLAIPLKRKQKVRRKNWTAEFRFRWCRFGRRIGYSGGKRELKAIQTVWNQNIHTGIRYRVGLLGRWATSAVAAANAQKKQVTVLMSAGETGCRGFDGQLEGYFLQEICL